MKVLMVVNTDGALYVFRKPILKQLILEGHEVITISSRSQYFENLKELGVRPISVEFSRHSISIVKNIVLLFQLYKIIKKEKPQVVHNFTHKAAIFGTIASKMAGVSSVFVTITGLGTLFVHENFKTKLTRTLLLFQYRFISHFVKKVFFQNPDDMSIFLDSKILNEGKAILTYGSGIDLNEFSYPTASAINKAKLLVGEELGVKLSGKIVVMFPARGIEEKGFYQFYKAAQIVNKVESGKYLFLHLGLIDVASSGNISKIGIDEFAKACGVEYMGHKDNIIDYMMAADIVALPSYREGTPRSLLEALALGKVIVTSDVPGCRETVIDGWNGFLCKVKDENSLASSFLKVDCQFIHDSSLRSRRYCEKKYNVEWLVKKTLNEYNKLS